MLSLPGSRIFKCIVNSDFFKVNKWDISELIDNAVKLNLDDLFALYEVDKDRVLAVMCLKTLFYVDNWVKYSTMSKVENISNCVDNLQIDPDVYTIRDNSQQYSMLEELTDNMGYMDTEDIAQDVIYVCLAFLNGEYDMGQKGNLSPLPQNVLERRLYSLRNELHLRATVPLLDDCERYDAMDTLRDVLPAAEGETETLINFDKQLCNCLYSGKKSNNSTFLDYSCGYACLDYAKLRTRINYLRRTKTGRGALEYLFSSLGMSRTAIARFIAAGWNMDAVIERSTKRGRPKKEQDAAPVKRGRGRPRKTA